MKKFFIKYKPIAWTLVAIISLIVILFLLCLSTYIPKVETTDYSSPACQGNGYISQKPLISAHRAGRNLAPENTMMAFKTCFEDNNEYTVDILEFDLHITKDKKLILLHDDTLDRTSDCAVYGEKKVRPENKTLAELKRYNMGYNFKVDGAYKFRGDVNLSDCRIVSLEEVLTYLRTQEDRWKKKFNYIIEIKNDGELGNEATEILYKIIKEFDIIDRTVVGTFHKSVSKYIDQNCPEIIRSAGIWEVLDFYFSSMFNVNLEKKNIKYKVLQIPYRDFVINLGKKSIIDYAHKYGIAVQYWTINKEKDIKHLSEIGADAIISDDPKLAYHTINAL